jgi:hypothetical protein
MGNLRPLPSTLTACRCAPLATASRVALHLCLAGLLVLPLSLRGDAARAADDRTLEQEFDIVVYGGTSAGVIAAVEAAKLNKSVVVVSPDIHLGGLSAGGLGFTDTGNKATIGGLSREFYHRVWKHYAQDDAWRWQTRAAYGNKGQGTPAIDGQQRTMWIFEPHVAETVFEDLVREHNLRVDRDQWLDRTPGAGVQLDGNRIVSLKTLAGRTYRGKMFIDATYEGDLLAAAGVTTTVGREANSQYGEKWNGIQVGTLHHGHWFKQPIDPYNIPGVPSSGLLPRISPGPPGEKGAADHRIQAYCYRMCLTQHPENRIPFPKPALYDPGEYELLLRVFATGWRETFDKYDPIPNLKTDTNNHGPFSTDNIGMNYDYPEASYERRREILEEHQRYQQGLMYFMANDPRMPDDVRREVATWGLAKDEFVDNGGWPHQIYVREARRMVGHYVMTEHDCLDLRETPDSVGMGSYTLDSHNVQRYVTPSGHVQNEGDIGVGTPRPYEIAYGALVPRVGECENILTPICISATHIAFGSIRMEPVFMILGHSAAAAASLAIDHQLPVQALPYPLLRELLLSEGQILELDDPDRISTSRLQGTVIDDEAAELTGQWTRSHATRPFVGGGYQHDGNTGKGGATASFSAELPPGSYEVRVHYPAEGNRAARVPIHVAHADGVTSVTVNQRDKHAAGTGVKLGTFRFNGTARVIISNRDTDGHVVIDAMQFIPQEP